MRHSGVFSTFFLFFVHVILKSVAYGKPLVPALFIFGDSIFDVGNNNYLLTLIKANSPPYGCDFQDHIPTGRFSNGKLIIDYASETLGFGSYQPAYLNLYIKEKNLLNGVNFASSGSGYHDLTAKLYNVISLSQQLKYYKDYQKELMKISGKSNVLSIISSGVHIVGTGSNDFLLNYYLNPVLQQAYTPYQFSDILVQYYSNYIKNLYALGARKIGVPTLPAIGCSPAAITLFGFHSNECVVKLNNVAIDMNQKLNSTSQNLRKLLPDLNLILLDSYQPLYNLVTKASEYGFLEARKACCGTGLLETSIFLCNKMSPGTCANASQYVFWDGYHPTQAANKILAAQFISEALPLFS